MDPESKKMVYTSSYVYDYAVHMYGRGNLKMAYEMFATVPTALENVFQKDLEHQLLEISLGKHPHMTVFSR
jgi:hypothetical protein